MGTDFDAEMAAVRRHYLAGLPALLDELSLAFQGGKPDVAAGVAHRIHGTAGSCGLGAVSAAAGRVEDLLLDGGDASDVQVAIAALREVVS